MLLKKDEENLSVEILDVKLDTSDVPNIKEAKLVYTNGKGKFVEDMGGNEADYMSPCQLKLNDVPIVQAKIPDCPTCCSVLATGYGIENTNCKELLDIQGKVNSNYISLEKSIENIKPLLTLFETGFYLIADAICYPTDGDKNFFWNVPNEPVETLATGPAPIYDEDSYFSYIYGEPVYLYPTQTTDSYDENRVGYYMDKIKELGDSSPRAIAYNFSDFINFVIDGHHKACASALLGEPLRCLLIIPGVFTKYYNVKEDKNKIYLAFSSTDISNVDIPEKYSSFVKVEIPAPRSKEIIIKDGIVNKRNWEKKYLDSAKNYLTQKEYGRMVDILINDNIEITDDLIEYCLINFDLKSQSKIEKIIYKLKIFDIEKAQDIALKYAKNSLKYEIGKNLREFIYKILVSMKDNNEVEQIFVDYYTYYSENKEDPVLEIINLYWENLKQ
ncbi:Uncharacterised protein [Fusobacterium nucleatum]|uniref:hypothetical protein n=1 Tax=Fusobacterium nucleatum TaxID=851 RepID=UPI00195EFADB|nr:hypothetical protein [Fusobacterium nucleatum]VTX49947.1 Uncharacterised protein [Fusobacterium nucleatum]